MLVIVLSLCIHSLASCDSYHIVDVINRAATAQVVYWTSNTLKDRTDSDSIAQTLNELIADVTNLKAWYYQYVSLTSDRATWSLLLTYRWYESCVSLEFTINIKPWSTLLSKTSSLNYLVYYLVLSRTLC